MVHVCTAMQNKLGFGVPLTPQEGDRIKRVANQYVGGGQEGDNTMCYQWWCLGGWSGGGQEGDDTMCYQWWWLGRWLGGGEEGDYTMCNQWWC